MVRRGASRGQLQFECERTTAEHEDAAGHPGCEEHARVGATCASSAQRDEGLLLRKRKKRRKSPHQDFKR